MATTFWPIQASESGVTVGTYLQQKLSTSEGTTNYVITTTTTTASGNHIEISDLSATIWLYRVRAVTISGSISFKVWGLESAMTVNAQPGVRIVRIDSSGTILSDVVADANAGHVPASEWGTAVASKSWSATPTSTAFSDGDWIGVIIHADAIGTMAAGSMNINYDGSAANNADTLITFTETILRYIPPQPAQALALIYHPIGLAQAQAQIKAFGVKGYAQAQVSIRPRVGLAQAVGLINGTYFMPFSDTFNRTVGSGLGTSDNTDTWTIILGTAANASVDGTKAIFVTEVGTQTTWDLPKTLINPSKGVEFSGTISIDKIPNTATWAISFGLHRSNNTSIGFQVDNNLWFDLAFYTSDQTDLRVNVGGIWASGTGNRESSYVGHPLSFKVHVIKTGETFRVRRKLWKSDTVNEPGWEDDEDITATAFPLAGHPRIILDNIGLNTNGPLTVTLDNLQILEAGLTYYAQAQAQIKAIGIKGYAQAQASILPKVGLAQVAGLINGTYFMPFSDTFNRTVGSGLGTSDNTDTWTILLGTAANASVDGTKATFITETSQDSIWDLQKTLINPSQGVEISGTSVSIDKIPSTFTSAIYISLHRSHTLGISNLFDNTLWCAINFYTNDIVELVTNVGGTQASGIGSRLSSYVGHIISFKAHIIITGSTFLVRRKIWYSDTTSEPGWLDESTITTSAVLAGHPRLLIYWDAGNSNLPFTLTLDNLQIFEAGLTRYAQAQASIVLYERIRIQAQAQARIYAFKVRGYGLAQTYISPSFGQNRFGQAKAVTAPKYTLPFMDNFNRPDQAGMGTAPNGDTWQILQGSVIYTNLNNSYITHTTDDAFLFDVWILPQTSFSHPASTSPFILEFTIKFRFYIKNTSSSLYIHFGFYDPYDTPNNVALGVEVSNVDYGGDSGSLNTRLNVGVGNSFNTSTVGDSNFILGEVTWVKARFHFTPGAGSTTYVSVSITNPYQEHFSDSSKAFIFDNYSNTVTKSVIFREPITLHMGLGLANKVSIEEISIEIVSPYSVANAQAYIGSFKVAQAQARIYAFNVQKYAQAQADLGKIKYAQAQAFIGSLGYAQANAKIKALGWEIVAQSGAFIKKSAAFGQAQVKIKATSTNFSTPYSQAQASIIQSSPMAHAQAQADLGRIQYAQAQTVIKATNRGFAQSQANIKTVNLLYAQVQAQIKTNYIFYAQAQTYIKQIYQSYAQAQAMLYIPQVSSPQTDLQNTGWEGVVI